MKVLIDHPCAFIAAVPTEMDVELAVLEPRQATSRALNPGMMQKPLTGRTRRGDLHAATP